MDRKSLKSALEISTNIAVLLLALTLLSILAVNFFRRPQLPNLSPGLERGKVFGPISNVDYASSEQTLLIALNTKCSFCRESLPHYRKLLDTVPRGSKSLHVVAIFPDSPEDVARYLKENQLSIDSIAEVDFASLRIGGTPTMVLVNNSGQVKDFWSGKLEDRDVDKFVDSLVAGNRRPQ